jgi:hypothetical protein
MESAPIVPKRLVEKRTIKAVNKDVKDSPPRTASSGKRRVQLYAKSKSPVSSKHAELNKPFVTTGSEEHPIASNDALAQAVAISTDASKVFSKVPSDDMSNHPDAKFEIISNTRKRMWATLSQSFPSLLHTFISDCAVSNPDIVQWNTDHTAFNVEIHHPDLPALLLQYFQRMLFIYVCCPLSMIARHFSLFYFSNFTLHVLLG